MNAYTKYLPFKSALEDLFGQEAWYALKESNNLGTWRKYGQKTLQAVELSIRDTVKIHDDKWLGEVSAKIRQGLEQVKTADEIDEVVAAVAGTMIEVSFLQIGFMPQRKGRPGSYPLRKGEWKFDGYRSVAYLQTREQKEDLFFAEQQRKIGFEKQLELRSKYRKSKSPLSYSAWCSEQEGHAGAA